MNQIDLIKHLQNDLVLHGERNVLVMVTKPHPSGHELLQSLKDYDVVSTKQGCGIWPKDKN
jgi:hypothetical protein